MNAPSSSDQAIDPTAWTVGVLGGTGNQGKGLALRWAAARGHGGDSLVVLAGSLYLVADFYRLLQKLGQADEIWGSA